MFFCSPVKVASSCQVTPSMLYWQPSAAVSVIALAAAVRSVGAAGADRSALPMVTVKLPVTGLWFGAVALK